MNKIDKILIMLGIFLVLFVAAILAVFVLTEGNEPTALVTVVGGALIAEVLALCKIKAGKQREKLEKIKRDCEN